MQRRLKRVRMAAPKNRGEHIASRFYILTGLVLVFSLLIHLTLLFVGAILVLCLLALTDIWAFYSLHEIRIRQQLSEQKALFGEDITLSISVENAKVLPLPVVELKEIIPRALPIKNLPLRRTNISSKAELEAMFSLSWYERVTQKYTVQCMNRGLYTFGPMKVTSSDAFGFINKETKYADEQQLLVYPLILPLQSFSLPSQRPFGDHRAQRRLLEDPTRTIGVRDYVYGDSMRRIDWKATARTLQMQSKVYESTTTYTLTIFLNASLLLDGYYGIHPELQEMAICAAASVANWAINEGYAVGLYANTAIQLSSEDDKDSIDSLDERETPENLARIVEQQIEQRRVHLSPSSSPEQLQRIMNTLARLQTYGQTPLEEVLIAEHNRLPAGSTIIIITNGVNERLTEQLVRMRRNGYAVTILFVGESAVPVKITGITVYRLGGETAWEKLLQEAQGYQQREILAGNIHVGFRL